MSGRIVGAPETPWHFWLVGALGVLWNAGGMFAWYSLMFGDPADMAMTPDMVAYFDAYPLWALAAYTMGTWGAFLGSLAVLARTRLAVWLFGIALIGLAGTTLHELVLSPPPEELRSTGQLIFTLVIWATTIGLLLYSRAMARRGVLR